MGYAVVRLFQDGQCVVYVYPLLLFLYTALCIVHDTTLVSFLNPRCDSFRFVAPDQAVPVSINLPANYLSAPAQVCYLCFEVYDPQNT